MENKKKKVGILFVCGPTVLFVVFLIIQSILSHESFLSSILMFILVLASPIIIFLLTVIAFKRVRMYKPSWSFLLVFIAVAAIGYSVLYVLEIHRRTYSSFGFDDGLRRMFSCYFWWGVLLLYAKTVCYDCE